MNRALVTSSILLLLTCLSGSARGQNCDYPWTITATPVDSQTVAVHLCGSSSGCQPHDPQFEVVGDQIQVSMTAAEPGACQCIEGQRVTNQTILVTPVAPGTYGVTAVLKDCGQPTVLGTTSVVVEACTPDAQTLCLNAGRFAARANFTPSPFGPPEGPGLLANAVPMTGDTGYFWFFDPANVELVVKVLDGCAVDGDFWLFAGGLTNVGVGLSVTDTRTNAIKTYFNYWGTPFQPIQDSSAFPCP